MRSFISLLALTVTATLPAFGQECESVIALSKVVSTVVSDKSSLEKHAADFCNEYNKTGSNSNSSSFGASYKFLAATFATSNASAESVASKYCSAEKREAQSQDAYRQYIESIAPNAYDAYQQCLKMKERGLSFSVNAGAVLPKQFVMFAHYTSPNETTKKAKVTYRTSEGISCSWDNKGTEKVRSIDSGTSAILECKRDNASSAGFVTVVRSDSGLAETLYLPWQAYDANGIPVSTLRELRESIGTLNAKGEDLTRKLGSMKLECLVSTSAPANMAQSATIPLPYQESYSLVGGGCHSGPGGGTNHNPITLVFEPTADKLGWQCSNGHQASLDVPATTVATVIYCKPVLGK